MLPFDAISFWGVTSPILADEFDEPPPPQALAERKRATSDMRNKAMDKNFIKHLPERLYCLFK